MGVNLIEHILFEKAGGRIWLDQQRMLLVHAQSMGALRNELISALGMERAKGLLLRMGYASGSQDAQTIRRLHPELTDTDLLVLGPQLHSIEGIVEASPLYMDIDIAKGHFYGEFLWKNSFESEVHRQAFGISTEPVCWIQLGYACGYVSGIMGKLVVFKESMCSATGDKHCINIGKPLKDWDDWEKLIKYFEPDLIFEQILDLQSQVTYLQESISQTPSNLIGCSQGFKHVCEMVSKAAHSNVTVLLLGETGVGKELFARTLHQQSSRANAPFIAINCAAIPNDLIEAELFGVEKGAFTGANQSRQGRFERADGGTLFLDEVVELSSCAQAKLLRVLQEGEVERVGGEQVRRVDVRIIAATNEDLKNAVKQGRFRSDLFYRLNVYPITIPPLRERKEDIPLLVRYFFERYNVLHAKKVKGVTDKAMAALLEYGWLGNIRELENAVERGIILADNHSMIEVQHLFASLPESPDLNNVGMKISQNGHLSNSTTTTNFNDVLDKLLEKPLNFEELEQQLIQRALEKTDACLSKAARLLGMTRPTLAYRLKKMHYTGRKTQ
ncbi:sigma-54-dependent Fis family transcriptional regulator [Beggiatoa leptomitoformis]|uniref:AAA domain-containing protein n=1 Tax=Beggiatoa leptomitoformis TaxID=288004 RepID=A0A2N9YCB8_9GAMM|nr:sigma-54-dependent Fis family transcriptional regulator [Beggiatoa leptomitoformis]ALG66625.1 AAA domain-containing protein [Beggiatoa leptomitoformis]AUI68064.1 AAA domain-containing protein [Beggiatoa leptomitoformis]